MTLMPKVRGAEIYSLSQVVTLAELDNCNGNLYVGTVEKLEYESVLTPICTYTNCSAVVCILLVPKIFWSSDFVESLTKASD